VTGLIGPLALVLALQATPAVIQPPGLSPQAAPAAAAPDVRTFSSPTTGPLLRMLGGVGLVCALASGVTWWARRRRVGTGGTSTTIQVMAARSLGPRHRLAVVEVAGRTLLLGVGSEAINLLADLTDPIAFSETLHERLPVAERNDRYGELEVPHA